MKQEPITSGNVLARRSTRNKNKNAPVDPLVKVEDEEEENTRLKRRLRQPVTKGSTRLKKEKSKIPKDSKRRKVDLFCKKCNYTYESMEVYLAHQLQVHKDELKEHHCHFCNRTYATRYNYHYHLLTIHGVEAPARSRNVIIRYPDRIPDIKDPNNYCCSCDYKFSTYSHYRTHLTNIHDMKVPSRPRKTRQLYPDRTPDIHDPNNSCCVCDTVYTSRVNFLKHLGKIHGIKLRSPSKKPKDKISNIQDISNVHSEITPDFNDPNNHCSVCDHTFSTRYYYRFHLNTKHAIKEQSGSQRLKIKYPDRVPNIKDPNNFCSTCDYTFASKNSYQKHLAGIHTNLMSREKK